VKTHGSNITSDNAVTTHKFHFIFLLYNITSQNVRFVAYSGSSETIVTIEKVLNIIAFTSKSCGVIFAL